MSETQLVRAKKSYNLCIFILFGDKKLPSYGDMNGIKY